LCALSTGYWDLLTYRTLAGLGIGGEWGIGMALVAEAWPAQSRARGLSFVGIGGPLGVLLAAFVAPALLPLIGWRGAFAGGVFARGGFAGSLALRLRGPVSEPAIFRKLERKRRFGLPFWDLFREWKTAKISLGMIVLCAMQSFGFFGLLIWLPTYLSTQFG